MRHLIKVILFSPTTFLGLLINCYAFLLDRVSGLLGQEAIDLYANSLKNRLATVHHRLGNQDLNLQFYVPNRLCHYRAESFSSKEPETLKWIDEFGDDGVLFDIGANIGLYSVYFARTKKQDVYAFEPSVFNLGLLAKNVNVNHVEDFVRIVTTPLSSSNQFADFRLSSPDEGGALSAFGVSFGQDGQELKKFINYKTMGFSLDYLIDSGSIKSKPALIKIDVDGIEHLILAGAQETLKRTECRSVLVEVNENFSEQFQAVHNIMTGCGFIMDPRYNQHRSDRNIPRNQIWTKP